MHPVDQEIYGQDALRRRDCVRACVASWMELPLHEVPHFYELAPEDTFSAARRWLRKRGVRLKRFGPAARPDTIYFASGHTVRSASQGGERHWVVMHADRMIHDPHPSRAGLIDIVYIAVPRNTWFRKLKLAFGVKW